MKEQEKQCGTCLLWVRNSQSAGYGHCTWEPGVLLPDWLHREFSGTASIRNRNHGDNCHCYRPKPPEPSANADSP